MLALASFNNPAGLEKAGNSNYYESANSGLPQIGVAGSGGRGTLAAGSLEMSNVDLSTEFTNLMAVQIRVTCKRGDGTTTQVALTQLVLDPSSRGSTLNPPTASSSSSGSSGSSMSSQ